MYGEIKTNLCAEFIKATKLKQGQVFLDMGSGIGNVVLQMAGQLQCECYGIEIMEHLHNLGLKQQQEFENRMRYVFFGNFS